MRKLNLTRLPFFFGLFLPFLITGLWLCVCCYLGWKSGRDFVVELHSFRWMMYLAAGAALYLVAVVVSVSALWFSRRELRSRGARATSLLALVIPAGFLLLGVRAIPSSFYAGRGAAYDALDHRAIYEAAVRVCDGVIESGEDFEYGSGDGAPTALPDALAVLTPLSVRADDAHLDMQLDGGGVSNVEGIVVILKGLDSWEQPEGVRRLDRELPVFAYRLPDGFS